MPDTYLRDNNLSHVCLLTVIMMQIVVKTPFRSILSFILIYPDFSEYTKLECTDYKLKCWLSDS